MLDQFTAELTRQVEFILKSACGDGENWGAVFESLGLEPNLASASLPAPEVEVRSALRAMKEKAGQYLDQLFSANPGLDSQRIEGIRKRLSMLVDHEIARYSTELCKTSSANQPALGVASIFQNAATSAKMSPWANLEYDRKISISCRTCGAPQEVQAVFSCEFCGSNVFDP